MHSQVDGPDRSVPVRAADVAESGTFSTFVTHADGHAVVYLRGELDMASAPTLAARLERLPARGSRSLVLDASELDFCDSSGLGVLVKQREQARAHGTHLVVRAPSPALRRLLDLTGLDDLIEAR